VIAGEADRQDDCRGDPHLEVRVQRPVVKEDGDEHCEWQMREVDPERSLRDVGKSGVHAGEPAFGQSEHAEDHEPGRHRVQEPVDPHLDRTRTKPEFGRGGGAHVVVAQGDDDEDRQQQSE